MAARNYVSTARVQSLATGITDIITSMTLSTSGGFDPTTLPTSYPYTLVIDPDLDTEEVVTVTAKVGSSFTIARGQDGTSGVAHSAGAVVKHMVTARDLQEPQNHINASTAVHGITGSVVGTTDSQTLSNKTLSSPTITGTLSMPVGAITSTMIADGTIVDGDINAAAAITKTKINGTAVTLADTGSVSTNMLADSSVTSAKIADGAIVNADINASAAIAGSKIADTAVTLTATQTMTNKSLTSPVITGTANSTAGTINFGTNASAITANSLTISATELGYLDGLTGTIQTQISSLLPTGMVVPYAGTSAPTGWLMCDGATYSNSTYSTLAGVLGTTYGGSVGTSFAVPDLRGRVPAGKDNMGATGTAGRLTAGISGGIGSGTTLGSTGGEQAHAQTATEMAAHTHDISHEHDILRGSGGSASTTRLSVGTTYSTSVSISNQTSIIGSTSGNAGSGAAANVLQPTIILNYIIKY